MSSLLPSLSSLFLLGITELHFNATENPFMESIKYGEKSDCENDPILLQLLVSHLCLVFITITAAESIDL